LSGSRISRAKLLRAFFLLLVIVAWAPAKASAPPPPEISVIAVPIRASLAPLKPEIERRVPKTFSGDATERRIDVHYDVARDPVQLNMIGGGLHVDTTVRYSMQACRGSFPCISCGIGEPRREVEIRLQTKLEWDPSWRLRSRTRLLPVHYAKPCQVTWLGIDITPRFVAPVIEQQLGSAVQIIDRRTPSLTDLRARAEQIWTALQTPSELAPRTWLVLEPTAVAMTPITGSGSMITSTLLLNAQTRVVIGEKPVTARKPLPALRRGDASATPGVRIPFDLDLPYEEASRLAARDYAGKTFIVDGRLLTITSLRLAPGGNGRLLVEAGIDYRGGHLRNYRGAVFLEGAPVFDAATSTIAVPDLDYSLAPRHRGFFTRIAERTAHDSIRKRLRESARFPLGPHIAEIREEVTRTLTRTLAPGVYLHGHADAIEPVSVTPIESGISLRLIATGVVEVEVR
jgi:hypothetical protein